MFRQTPLRPILVCGISALLVSGACNRNGDESKPVAESQSQSARPTNEPLTVAGCLKAGDAADTFVLTTARTAGSAQTATYQLVAGPNINLRDHIGDRVEVSGVADSQHELASRTTAVPTDRDRSDRPTGTTGTPKIETKTEVDVKRLSVTAIKPLADSCDMQ
jgi:hypothetical protein